MQRRQHHRVRLRLPVRLRWTAPFGQQTELCESLDVARGGLLLSCKYPHVPGASLWAAFPYELSLPDGQMEIPARVVRCAKYQENNSATSPAGSNEDFALALCFDPPSHAANNGNSHRTATERRRSPRHALSVPVRVRPEPIPWFEETMTLDVSSEGLRFVSNREYAAAEFLLISFDPFVSLSWPVGQEIRARIVRTATLPESSALAVSVQRLP